MKTISLNEQFSISRFPDALMKTNFLPGRSVSDSDMSATPPVGDAITNETVEVAGSALRRLLRWAANLCFADSVLSTLAAVLDVSESRQFLQELFEQVPSQKPMQDIAAVNFCLIVLVMRGESIECCLIPPHSHVTMEEPAVLRWRQNLVASLIGDWGSDRNPHPHDCAGGFLQGVLQNMHAVCQRLGASLPSMPAGAYEHEVVRCAVETCEREKLKETWNPLPCVPLAVPETEQGRCWPGRRYPGEGVVVVVVMVMMMVMLMMVVMMVAVVMMMVMVMVL